MVEFRSSDLHRQARELQQRAGNPKKLVLIHTAVALGSSLLITVLNYLFSLQIAETGGLSGLGLRSILSTVQASLELIVMAALPFWEIGLLFAALQWTKGETVEVRSLFQGFRRFGTVLAFRLLYGGIFAVLGLAVFHISTFLFVMTPFAAPLMELLAPILDPSATAQQLETLLTPELMSTAAKTMTPLFVLFGILFLLLAIPVFYRLRFGEFALMEGTGAWRALLKSLQITQRNTGKLLKLDLHFWWFYLLQVLCLAISWADTVLPHLGITLPVSQEVGYFLFFTAGTVLQGVLLWQYQGQVLTTYCLAYDALTGRTLTESE